MNGDEMQNQNTEPKTEIVDDSTSTLSKLGAGLLSAAALAGLYPFVHDSIPAVIAADRDAAIKENELRATLDEYLNVEAIYAESMLDVYQDGQKVRFGASNFSVTPISLKGRFGASTYAVTELAFKSAETELPFETWLADAAEKHGEADAILFKVATSNFSIDATMPIEIYSEYKKALRLQTKQEVIFAGALQKSEEGMTFVVEKVLNAPVIAESS